MNASDALTSTSKCPYYHFRIGTASNSISCIHTNEYEVEEVSPLLPGEPLPDDDVERRVEGPLRHALQHPRRDERAHAGARDQRRRNRQQGGDTGAKTFVKERF